MIKYSDFIKSRIYAYTNIVPALERAALLNETPIGEYNNRYIFERKNSFTLGSETNAISSCGFLIKVIECTNCGHQEFKGYYRCKSRYCPTCARLKSYIWCAALYPKLKDWIDAGYYVTFGNFTIPNTEDLQQGIDTINNAWRFMTNKLYKKEFKQRFDGGIKSLEVKRGKYSHLWHPHFHCIFLSKQKKKDFDFMRNAWQKAVEHVGGGKANPPDMHGVRNNNEKGFIANILEVVKYITKLNDLVKMEPEDISHLYYTMKGAHTINPWGCLRGTLKKVEKIDEEENEDKIVGYVCKKCGCTEGVLKEISDNIWRGIQDMDNYEESCTFSSERERE